MQWQYYRNPKNLDPDLANWKIAADMLIEACKIMGWDLAIEDGPPNGALKGVLLGDAEFLRTHTLNDK